MKKVISILVRILWLSICIAALVDAHIGYQGNSDWKLEEGLAFEMLILSFPASFVVVAVLILLGEGLRLFGLALPGSNRAEMTITWLLFVMAGYIQWFLLLPKLWRSKRKV